MRNEVITTADSYPYITGMGFRNRCHLIYDEFHKGNPSSISEDGQVVFIKTDLVPMFFRNIMPEIKYAVKIITHNSALGIDKEYTQFLDNPKVITWYGQNANFKHPKLNSIPLGLANLRWGHGNVKQLLEVLEDKQERTHLLYMNFDIGTNADKRSKVFNLFSEKDFVFSADRKSFQEYLRDLSSSKYALSPAGAGIDCHRVWESLAVGTIPIVESCHNISFYKNLPILIVDDWNEITKEWLDAKYVEIKNNSNIPSLFLDYWIKKIGLLEKSYKTIHNQEGSNLNLFMVT